MPEKNTEKSEFRFSKEEIEKAKEGFEHLAQRLDELWTKDTLTPEEETEVELIMNNAMVLEEIIEGKTPEEFQEQR